MSRYIDADAIIEKKWQAESEACFYALEDVISVTDIDEAPSIDIVRCKECKHYAEHNELYINAPTNCVKHSTINHYVVVNADDFCSYGEREGE